MVYQLPSTVRPAIGASIRHTPIDCAMNLPIDSYELHERRLTALEESMMHLEQMVGQLNSALISQQRQIEALETRLKRWQEKGRALSSDSAEDDLSTP